MSVLLVSIAIGLGAGVLSALLGVGGGIVMVPAMTYFLKIPFKLAVGTSLAIIIPTAISGSIRHWLNANIDWRAAGLIAIGAIVGAQLGAGWVEKIPVLTLKRTFAVLLFYTAVRMALGK